MHLRIPAWAEGASVAVNGKRVRDGVNPGTFATIWKHWKSGDRIELELPLLTRLEPINPRHPETVALLSGPIVLFAIGATPSSVKREELLNAKKVGPQKWQAKTAAGAINLLPFTVISDEAYTTYLKLPLIQSMERRASAPAWSGEMPVPYPLITACPQFRALPRSFPSPTCALNQAATDPVPG